MKIPVQSTSRPLCGELTSRGIFDQGIASCKRLANSRCIYLATLVICVVWLQNTALVAQTQPRSDSPVTQSLEQTVRPASVVVASQIEGSTGNSNFLDRGFRVHELNAESEFSSASVLDVNNDGKLDIVCGAWWYESPAWKKHYFRDVEQIRGRFDDYSNLVVDIDGDGFQDIVSVNYRSQSLYWCRNPGGKQSSQGAQTSDNSAEPIWKSTIIDRPGGSETGRLVDVDGDGKLDILPAGTNFAAWYEFVVESGVVQWRKHALPDELKGHGIGSGDINGDGRLDLIGPNGWAEAPVDRRLERWKWHPDFHLAKDCSIPILCWDVDQDGDQDLVWSRAHNVGIYWTERVSDQTRSPQLASSVQAVSDATKREVLDRISCQGWVTHAIDTSWSNVHSLMTADLDGDGQPELVAGKRYLAHDGKDPGEYDPLAVQCYKFNKSSRTWASVTISQGGRCGIDLDSVCVDLDGDGDIDVLAPARCGLHWIENLRIDSSATEIQDRVDTSVSYTDHKNVLHYFDESNQRRPIDSPHGHGIRRSHILANMQRVMGELPLSEKRVPLDTVVQSIEEADGYWRIHLTYSADKTGDRLDRVPAYLLVPKVLDKPAPAMLCLHQTQFELGKGEPCGMGGNSNLHYAHELAQRGFVCLAPDYPGFSEYQYNFDDHVQDYASGTMKGIWNHIRGVDLLEALPCVRRDSIGVIGHSLGGHNGLFVAAFDLRLRWVVTSCGFNAFENYYGGNLKGWTSSRYMPRIATQFNSSPKQLPFDFPEVLAAIAPRPIFVNAPRGDSNFAVVGVEKCEAELRPLYDKIYRMNDRMVFKYPEADHDFTESVRMEAYEWLRALQRD